VEPVVTDLAELEIGSSGGYPLARLRGELDLSNVARLHRVIAESASGEAGALVLDLTDLTFMDSAGIRMLVELAGDLASHRRRLLVVLSPENPTHRSLELSGVLPALEVAPTIEAALEQLG
jgi:anti-sigma B factor antagonist